MPKAIPDRWEAYSCLGSVIEGTRLICFKVPLKKNVMEHSIRNGAQIGDIWDVEALVKAVPKLRLVIDLTNTARYYDPKMLENEGIEHKKIALPGRVIPPENIVKSFFHTVDRFMETKDDTLLGVHCTHGLNRTGYMVCRYLRDRLGMPADKAIEIFEAARGYKIERENYIASLRGEEPPEPDFGQETEVKPIGTNHRIPNYIENRSHIQENYYTDSSRYYNNNTQRDRSKGGYGRHQAMYSQNYRNDYYGRDRSPVRENGSRYEEDGRRGRYAAYRKHVEIDVRSRNSGDGFRNNNGQDYRASRHYDRSPRSRNRRSSSEDIDYTYEY